MKDIFSQNAAKKRVVRRRESELLASGKVSPMQLGQQNFCMKGVQLSKFKNSDGGFSLF
jgi:hypothetical protein